MFIGRKDSTAKKAIHIAKAILNNKINNKINDKINDKIAKKTHSRWGGGNEERTVQKLKLFLQSRDKEIITSVAKNLSAKEDKSRLDPSQPQKYKELEVKLAKKKIANLFKEFEGNKEQHWQRLFRGLDAAEILAINSYNNFYKPELVDYFLDQLLEKAKEIKTENNKELPLYFQKMIMQMESFLERRNIERINFVNLNESLISKLNVLIHIIKSHYQQSSAAPGTIGEEIMPEPAVMKPVEVMNDLCLPLEPEAALAKEVCIRKYAIVRPVVASAPEEENDEKTIIAFLKHSFGQKDSYWEENRSLRTIQKLQLVLQNRNYQITALGGKVKKAQELAPEEPEKYALLPMPEGNYKHAEKKGINLILRDFKANKIKHWQRLSLGIEQIAKTMCSPSCKPEIAKFFIKNLIEKVHGLPINLNNNFNSENIKALETIKEKLLPVGLITLDNPGQASIAASINELKATIEKKISAILAVVVKTPLEPLEPLEESKKPKKLSHWHKPGHNYWKKDIAHKTIQKLQLVLQNRNYQEPANKKDETPGLLLPGEPRRYKELPPGGNYNEAKEQGIAVILADFCSNKAGHWEYLNHGIEEIINTIKTTECQPEIAQFFIEELTRKIQQFKTSPGRWQKKRVMCEKIKISMFIQAIEGHLAKLEENLKSVDSPHQGKLIESLGKIKEKIVVKTGEVKKIVSEETEKTNEAKKGKSGLLGGSITFLGVVGIIPSVVESVASAALVCSGIALTGIAILVSSALWRHFKPTSKLTAPIIVTAAANLLKPTDKQSQR